MYDFRLKLISVVGTQQKMSAKTGYCIENMFTFANRQRCMSKFKNLPVPAYASSRTPTSSAAVLVPLCRIDGVPSLLYTVRSTNLRTDSHQVSFPGGKMDKKETPVEAALRETNEEIGLAPEKICIWGHGPPFPGRNRKVLVTPVVGSIDELRVEDLKINEDEVAEVFAVSVAVLCNPKNQYYTQFTNGFILPVFVADKFKIWGLTAYITHLFLNCSLSPDVYRNEWTKKKIVLS